MKIAFLTAANSWHVPVKTKYFVQSGHQVYYLGILPGTGHKIISKGIKTFEIGSSANRLKREVQIVSELGRITSDLDLDILHVIDMGFSQYALFANAKKIVFENNGSDVLIAPQESFITRLKYKWLYRYADGVVQDSYQSQAAGIKYGAPSDFNEIIELGVDFNIFNRNISKGIARRRLNISAEIKFVFSPRGFTELYNIETIIRSIPLVRKEIKNVKFVFCRHFGELETPIKKLADQLDVAEDILFTGFLNNESEMPYYYADADVVVSIPSSDSSPRSVYEAMACGTPVIISDLEWYKGKFNDKEDLIVVPVKDHCALAQSVIEVLSKRSVINVNSAYQKVESNINVLTHSRKLEHFYRMLLDQ